MNQELTQPFFCRNLKLFFQTKHRHSHLHLAAKKTAKQQTSEQSLFTAVLGMLWRHWRTIHNLAKLLLFKEYLQCDSRQKSVLIPAKEPVLLLFVCCAAAWLALQTTSQLTPRFEKGYYWGDGLSTLCFPSANTPPQFSCNSWSMQLVTNSQVKGFIFSRYKRNYMTDFICFPFHPWSLLCTCTSFPLQKIWFCFASFSCQPALGTQRSFCILCLLFLLPRSSS